MPAVIGALRADLSATIAQFEDDMRRASGAVARFGRDAQRTGQQIQAAGQTMTLALTAPLVAFIALTARTAGNFEATMNRVQVATSATAAEVAQLTAQARQFGSDRRFTATATEAAQAMENLAKNGVTTTDILGGAERATLTLAAATGGNFSDSADVATAAMQQFHVQAGDLPRVVDQITGVLLVSRMGFDDYRLAMGQAGGVAGGLGVSLEDFNAVLASTSTLFGSGSDAGTSFKTFLTRLQPQSDQARRTMQQLGLSFYDAQGRMRSMADIAEQLRVHLGPLSEATRAQALTQIFGTDAMRTAIGLMAQGREGIERYQRQIAGSNAEEQMATRTRGLNGAVTNFRRALETLMLRVADSGLLAGLTALVNKVTDFVGALGNVPRPVLAVAAAFAGLLAIIGPALVVLGFVIQGLGNLAVIAPIAGAAVGLLARAMLFLVATPVGAALTAIAIILAVVIGRMHDLEQPTRAVIAANTALVTATEAYTTAAMAAAGASGEARVAALREAAAKRELAVQARNAAAAQLTQARATLALIAVENARAINADRYSTHGDRPGTILPTINQGRATQAQASVDAASGALATADRDIANADRVLHAGDHIVAAAGDTGVNIANLGETASGSANRTAAHARQVARARRELEEGLARMQQETQYGLADSRPQSTRQADDLRGQLRDLEERAHDAGVSTGAFADQIAALRNRIDTLQVAERAREVVDFGHSAADAERDILRFANGGLDPMAEALAGVDDRFDELERRLHDLIEANRALADQSPAAQQALARLIVLYDDLSRASQVAAEAAARHVRAIQAIIAAQAAIDANRQRGDINDLRQSRGDFGAASSAAQEHQQITRDLEARRLQAAHDLLVLQDQLDAATAQGDAEEIARLTQAVALQQQLYDAVAATTTAQIQAQNRLQALVSALEDSVRSSVSDLIYGVMTEGKNFDFGGWAKSFLQKITRAIADNWAQGITDSIMNALGIGRQMRVQTIIAGTIVGGSAGGAMPGGSLASTAMNAAGQFAMRAASAIFHALPGFATGGQFAVPGSGGIDSQLVAFRATPGEPVRVGDEPPGGSHLNVNISLDGASGDEHIRQIAYTAAAQGTAQAIDVTRRSASGAAIQSDLLGTP